MQVVIVVDTQRDFMAADGALSVPGADALAAPMAAWLGTLAPAGTAAVLWTFDTHFAETYADTAEAREFPPHCFRGTPGWDNLLGPELIDPAIPAWRLEKHVFAMWEEPALTIEDARDPAAAPVDRDRWFASLRANGVAKATVIGVAADYCVRFAVEGLVARGFRVTVPAALTRGIAQPIAAVAARFPAGTVAVV